MDTEGEAKHTAAGELRIMQHTQRVVPTMLSKNFPADRESSGYTHGLSDLRAAYPGMMPLSCVR